MTSLGLGTTYLSKNLATPSHFAKSTSRQELGIVVLAAFLFAWFVIPALAQETQKDAKQPFDRMLVEAFTQSHAGYSSDEVLIQPILRTAFLDSLRQQGVTIETDAEERDALLRLLSLRKAGKLKVTATKRGTTPGESYTTIAEIAARVVTDRHRVTTDTMLCDPSLRREFLAEAAKLGDELDEYQLAKSVLRLRKIRQLKPELVLRVADWNRVIETYSIADLTVRIAEGAIPATPGVYLFRDASGYLYIGEASNLAARLAEHVSGSDRVLLAGYLQSEAASDVSVELHIFPADSRASRVTVRRAYESELIRSRQPKFNVRP